MKPRRHAAGTPTRRDWLAGAAASGLSASGLFVPGCSGAGTTEGALGHTDAVWGVHGIAGERMHKPRAMTIDAEDRVYLVDFTARVLVYDRDGVFLRGWSTPTSENGRPTGVTFDPVRGELLVADTHYYRVLAYSLDGELREDRTVGGVCGDGPGEFAFVTDAVRDSAGNLYASEYGENDRVQKFSPDGEYLTQWGSHGHRDGQFKRPQTLIVDAEDRVWVCDSCNHRLQVFDGTGELLFAWGEEGSEPGQLYYPYGAAMDAAGDLYVVEYGNHRVQKFNQRGESLGVWGGNGREPGRLWSPWAAALDSRGALFVLDTMNHRVQRVLV
ncbi:MAG: hypothetical protein AAF805_09055 [Planctomycetota bacterium]